MAKTKKVYAGFPKHCESMQIEKTHEACAYRIGPTQQPNGHANMATCAKNGTYTTRSMYDWDKVERANRASKKGA